MVGPLVYQEMLLVSRQMRNYLLRWIYAAWLLLETLYFVLLFVRDLSTPTHDGQPAYLIPLFSHAFVVTFIKQYFILLVLIVPAFVAGTITDEKNRGTLPCLLISDLTSLEIVLGKWLGRISQVALLALTGIPLLFLFGGWGGVSFLALCSIIPLTVLVVSGLGAAALLASVWCRQTRDAVLALYTIGIISVLFGWWVRGPFLYFDPYYIFEPAWGTGHRGAIGELWHRLKLACIAWGGLGGCCLALASWRLRPTYLRQRENYTRQRQWPQWCAERVPVTDEPLRWKEWHVDGLAPLQFLRRLPRWLGMLGIFVGTCCTSSLILKCSAATNGTFSQAMALLAQNKLLSWMNNSLLPANTGFQMQAIMATLLFSLVVSIRCSGTISGERERQTWDALLLTRMNERELIGQKHWGILAASYGYVAAYAAPAVVFSLLGGIIATFWTVVWLSITFLFMYFAGAAGIWCSVRFKNSWVSLLGALVLSFLGITASAVVLFGSLGLICGLMNIGNVFLQSQRGNRFGVYRRKLTSIRSKKPWRSRLGTFAKRYWGGTFAYYLAMPPLLGIVVALLLFVLILVQEIFDNPISSTASGANKTFLITSWLGMCVLLLVYWGLAYTLLRSARKWVEEQERTCHRNREPAPGKSQPHAAKA